MTTRRSGEPVHVSVALDEALAELGERLARLASDTQRAAARDHLTRGLRDAAAAIREEIDMKTNETTDGQPLPATFHVEPLAVRFLEVTPARVVYERDGVRHEATADDLAACVCAGRSKFEAAGVFARIGAEVAAAPRDPALAEPTDEQLAAYRKGRGE
jgi:hypothetical protein